MKYWVVDTNVAVVANGRGTDGRPVSVECRRKSVEFLVQFVEGDDAVLVDSAGSVQEEYLRHLNPEGSPGVGDMFLQKILQDVNAIRRVKLSVDANGQYVDLPADIVSSGFDQDDRKFVALALKERAPVVNSVDSDWVEHRAPLEGCGVKIKFLCGVDIPRWFDD